MKSVDFVYEFFLGRKSYRRIKVRIDEIRVDGIRYELSGFQFVLGLEIRMWIQWIWSPGVDATASTRGSCKFDWFYKRIQRIASREGQTLQIVKFDWFYKRIGRNAVREPQPSKPLNSIGFISELSKFPVLALWSPPETKFAMVYTRIQRIVVSPLESAGDEIR